MMDTGEVASFLSKEAELLDGGEYDARLALFADDARYWVPSYSEQTDPLCEFSPFYEDRPLMHARTGRPRHPRALGVPVRTSSLIGNVRLTGHYADGTLIVRSRFQMIEFINDEQRRHGGGITHHLVPGDDSWKNRFKRVDLVSANGIFGFLQVFF
jgi:3-phenylpropionate/cinnamic acid dioxygenase small subunit